MRAKIREMLARKGTLRTGHQMPATAAGTDSGFVDLCVVQIIEHQSFTVKQLAEMLEVSEDWVLKNFKNVAGVFRHGKVIRFPYEAVKSRIRSMLAL